MNEYCATKLCCATIVQTSASQCKHGRPQTAGTRLHCLCRLSLLNLTASARRWEQAWRHTRSFVCNCNAWNAAQIVSISCRSNPASERKRKRKRKKSCRIYLRGGQWPFPPQAKHCPVPSSGVFFLRLAEPIYGGSFGPGSGEGGGP